MRDCLEGLSPVPLKQIPLFETWENRIVQHKLFEYSGSFSPCERKFLCPRCSRGLCGEDIGESSGVCLYFEY